MDEVNEVVHLVDHSDQSSKSSQESEEKEHTELHLLRIPTMHSEIESKRPRPMQLNLTDIKPEDSERMATPSIFSPIIHHLGEDPRTVIKNDL
jgi:hypothetical protein